MIELDIITLHRIWLDSKLYKFKGVEAAAWKIIESIKNEQKKEQR